MTQLHSKEEYEAIKQQHRAIAREKESKIKRDLSRVLSDATPRYVREKLATSCIIFGATYLAEELIFRQRVPGIVKFAGAIATTTFAPKIYRMLYRNYYQPARLPASYAPPSNGTMDESLTSTSPPVAE